MFEEYIILVDQCFSVKKEKSETSGKKRKADEDIDYQDFKKVS